MIGGGGIARFASRQASSSNGNESSAPSSENGRKIDTETNNVSFSCSDKNDALSTGSDEEFGFLGGDSSMGGGEDFFMMSDGDFNRDYNADNGVDGDTTGALEVWFLQLSTQSNFMQILHSYSSNFIQHNTIVSSSTTTNEVNKSHQLQGQSDGISLFRGRSASFSNSMSEKGNQVEEADKVTPLSNIPKTITTPLLNKLTHDQLMLTKESSLRTTNEMDSTQPVMIPKKTPDGRILPMPVYASNDTTDNSNNKELFSSEHRLVSPLTTPQDNTSITMAPPPKRYSTFTPSDTLTLDQTEIQFNGPMKTQLFVSHEESSEINSIAMTVTNESSDKISNIVERDSVLTDNTNNGDDSRNNNNDFHQRYQKFTTLICDINDKDRQYQDMMFDGMVKVDVAKSILLHMKYDMYKVTAQLLQELDYVNNAIQEYSSDVC
jgi:hypothetical protein